MKTLFTIIVVLLSLTANAQNWPIDKETGKITFTEVVTIDSATKNDLYLRAREWFAKTYNDSKEVIQVDDKETGKIIGKAIYRVNVHSFGIHPGGIVNYTILLLVKDGRYKYEITDLYHEGGQSGLGSGGNLANEKSACGNFMLTQKYFSEIKQQSYDQTISLIDSLKLAMKSKSLTKNENW
jgi:hypothetical protein